MINVGAGIVSPSHILSLSDGTKTLGLITCDRQGVIGVNKGWSQAPMPRTPLKISQGSQGYEDFELPFTSIEMQDWSGGMNAENFESDKSKYRDGLHCDATRGDIICGPKDIVTTSFVTEETIGSTGYTGLMIGHGDTPHVSKYVPDEEITLYSIKFMSQGEISKAVVYSSSEGEPDDLLASGEIHAGWGDVVVTLDTPQILSAGTLYFIGVWGDPTEMRYMPNIYYNNEVGNSILYLNDDSWTVRSTDKSLAYQLIVGGLTNSRNYKFFEHRRSQYVIANQDDGSAPRLYRNGYRGAAKSNAGELTKLKTGLDLEDIDLSGCIALIIEGPGVKEEQPWRHIISNTVTGTNDIITVDKPWNVAHTTATSFVILGNDDWTLIEGHGLTGRVTDIVNAYDYIIFAQGDGINMRRMREYNNAGTWTTEYKADGTNKADLLLVVANTEGTMKLWKALVDSNEVKSASLVSYSGADHSFGDAITIGSSQYSNITGMLAYGDPRIPYVFKEDSFGSIQNEIYAEVPIGEMAAVRSEWNGKALMTHGVYLYFNLSEKIERYYDRRLDDIGPDGGEGLPAARQGIVRKLMPYPGRYYALLYGDDGTPSILCNNGMGWHEIWRGVSVTSDGSGATGDAAPFAYNVLNESGKRANDMTVQVIPGRTMDRLWFDYGGQIYYLPITFNPKKEPNYQYRDLSQLETGWIYSNLKDVVKYWHSVKIHSENLYKDMRTVMVEYKTDDQKGWTVAGYATESPIEEINLSSAYNVIGYRIKFRFTLHTDSATYTPRIVAVVVKGVVRVEVKKGWSITVLTDPSHDLNGRTDTQENILETLDGWANSDITASPLTMKHNLEYYDDKRVFIDPASIMPLMVELEPTKGQGKRQYQEIATFNVYEV